MSQCSECKHYDSRPQGGGAVCKRVGVSGMYVRESRSSKGPCGLEGRLFESVNLSLSEENAKLCAHISELERKLAAQQVRLTSLLRSVYHCQKEHSHFHDDDCARIKDIDGFTALNTLLAKAREEGYRLGQQNPIEHSESVRIGTWDVEFIDNEGNRE